MGIALFDLDSNQTRLLYPTNLDQEPFDFLVSRWKGDSRTALVIGSWKEKKCDDPKTFETIMLIDTVSGEITKSYVNEGATINEGMTAFVPALVQERYVIVGGESLIRFDLLTGESKHKNFEGDVIVPVQSGETVYYYKGGGENGIEYGAIDVGDLTLKSLHYVSPATLGKFSADGKLEIGNLAISPDGSRLALYAVIDSRMPAIAVFSDDEIEFLSKASACHENTEFTNLEWSPDGKKIFVGTVSKKPGTERGLRFGVCEYSLEQETACYKTLFELEIGVTEFFWSRYQLRISQDGERLAVISTLLDSLDPGDEHRILHVLNAQRLEDEPIVVRPPYAQQPMSDENLAARCDFYHSRRTYFEDRLADGMLIFGAAWVNENIAWLKTMQKKHCGLE
jgi:hypothetical protein